MELRARQARRCACGVLVCTAALQPAAAQRLGADSAAAVRPVPRTWTPEVSLEILGASAVLSLWDEGIARRMRAWHDGSSASGQRWGERITNVGGVAPLAGGAALFLTGVIRKDAFTRHLGQDVTEAVVTSGLITGVLKGLTGRARPRMFPDDADAYAPLEGFTNGLRASFPSGHTTGAFAAATVLAHEIGAAHPTKRKWLNVALYGSAGLVGLSRMYVNAHWSSDVLAGAAIGTVSGLRVMRRMHRGM